MCKLWLAMFVVGTVVLGGVALADPPKRLTFDDDVVSGEVPTADGLVSSAVKHAAWKMLIKPRLHFLPELVRSADDR